ncbi:MAG: SPOR domain-containing protein [Prevotella sp.]|nr:SPOR domain-containing protein [Prevotella sp.]
MKKSLILSAGLCAVLTLASCGSKESAYRKAYDKAQAAEAEANLASNNVQNAETPVVTPLTPATPQPTVDNYDNVTYRQESVTLVNGSGLKNFSVVVGSFSVQANAQGLQNTLKAAGYDAQIVKNNERGMFRVIAATFNDKVDAARSRDAFRSKYPDAWLLYNK